jgi:hypothetical protein
MFLRLDREKRPQWTLDENDYFIFLKTRVVESFSKRLSALVLNLGSLILNKSRSIFIIFIC